MVCGPQRYCDVSTSGFTSSRNATLRGSIGTGPKLSRRARSARSTGTTRSFTRPVPSDDEEGEEDEDDHWDEDDIDEDDEDGDHYNADDNNNENDVISTDGWGMIEGEDLDFDDGF